MQHSDSGDYTYDEPVRLVATPHRTIPPMTLQEEVRAEIDALRAELTGLIMNQMGIYGRLAHLEVAVHSLLNSDEEPDAETVQP